MESSSTPPRNTAAYEAHDYGNIICSAPCWHSETHNARAASTETLRVAAMVPNYPSSGTPANETNCTSDTCVSMWLFADDSSGGANNYQYLTIPPTGQTQTFTLKIWINSWNGLSQTTYGIAWAGLN